MEFKGARSVHYPGLAMLGCCLAPPRRGFGAGGVDDSSVAVFGFFARLAEDDFAAEGVFSELGSGSGEALRLRDRG